MRVLRWFLRRLFGRRGCVDMTGEQAWRLYEAMDRRQ
jgi:hypothetical protein